MEKIKKVTITDGGNKKTFSVRLFGALEGLEFIDHVVGMFSEQNSTMSVMAVADKLLPLATLLSGTGDPIDTMGTGKVDTYFESPIAVVELCIEIFQHQMVFMNESETFRKYIPKVQKAFGQMNSDSVTQ